MKKTSLSTGAGLLLAASLAFAGQAQTPGKPAPKAPATNQKIVPTSGLRPVAVQMFPDQRLTGVAVSKQNRIFVNFPYWEDGHRESVVEVLPGGQLRPFPDAAWNRPFAAETPPADPAKQFICVQSVVVDAKDRLWILDPASPKFRGVVPGGAKLVQVDLATNRPVRTITFGPEAVMPKSYLNDLRIDTQREVAYLTDSGMGSLLVLDLKTGRARRVLDGHASARPDPAFALVVNGHELRDKNGDKPNFQADGIELSADGNTLYFQALMGTKSYRIATGFLRDNTLSDNERLKHLEQWATPGASDGYGRDAAGNLYTSGIENNTIRRLSPAGAVSTVAQGPEISWPDTFATGPDGMLYFTTSQIQTQAKWNKGRETRTTPYGLWKLKVQ